MIDPALASQLAAELIQADRTKTPARQISQRHPLFTVEDAYAIQRAGVALAEQNGRVVAGRKIGLTSRVMQQSVNITEPDYGVLYRDMFYGDGDTISFDRFIAPRIEMELAFVLHSPLRGPDCSIFDVLRATEYVTPAIEILDARIQMTDPDTKSTRTIVDTISDNAADAGIVVGGRPVGPSEVDLRWVSALLYRDGGVEESGVAASVLNHPANGVAWLANRLWGHGVELQPGQVILAGSFIRPVWVRPGDQFHADYGPLGTIGFTFTRPT
jgi:2-oxo-hept-3-ene-1,7-dioate hydratase